jgi:hypothetical protein
VAGKLEMQSHCSVEIDWLLGEKHFSLATIVVLFR